MNFCLKLVPFFVVFAFMVPNANADLILQPTDVSTDMGVFNSSFAVGNLIDQSGLSPGYVTGFTEASTYTAMHEGSSLSHWISTDGTTTGFISFDLGSVQSLNGFLLWNSTFGLGPGFVDVNGFELFADTDMDSTNGFGASLGSFNAANTNDPHPKQTFSLTTASTRFVQMQINSNHGSRATGFGEAAFTTAVPEPTSLALFGIALASIARRRRHLICKAE